MQSKFINPLPLVADMQVAKDFYRDVVGLSVAQDHGDFVRFSSGFALHDGASLLKQAALPASDVTPFGRNNLVLYFETEDLDAAFDWIAPRAEILHPIVQQGWGGRVFRFRDPDGHIIEMGTP